MSKGKFRTRSCTIRETQVAANLPPVIGGRGAGSGAGGGAGGEGGGATILVCRDVVADGWSWNL